jgi:phage anti-repressor protein
MVEIHARSMSTRPSRYRHVVMTMVFIVGCLVALIAPTDAAVAGDGYPHDNATGCSAQYGEFSWCIGGWWLSSRGYGYRNCTDYVAWKLESLGVPSQVRTGLGHARDWGTNAAARGVTVNDVPAAGSVAINTTSAGGLGHVAYVAATSGSTITVQEYNSAGTGAYSTWSGSPASRGFTLFAHFEVYMPDPPGGDHSGGSSPVIENFARNGGFDHGSTRWSAVSANFVTRNDSDAYSGGGYGRTNTASGGYIRNDYAMTIDSTDHFCMEAMVRADPGGTASGALVLWLLGGSGNENTSAPFTVSDQWTLVKTCTYATGDHTSVSARVYPTTGGATVSVDTVDVHRSVARNGGFDHGSTRWSAVSANFVTRNDSDAYSGGGYGRTNTASGGYIRNDYAMTIDSTDHFCMEAMVRADPGGTASGALVLWLLGGSGNENTSAPFTVSDQWTLVKTCTYATGDHTSVSARVYPTTGGATVSVDTVDVH